jgi:4-hydroxy-tetrahydrodipicolinate synthase
VISITPFTEAGEVDEHGFRRHLRRLAPTGIGVYVGGGGSGEGYTLSEDEVRRLLEIAVEELKGKVPVRAMGVEPRTAAEMVRFVELAAEAGVDGVQVYSLDVGHGHHPSPAELEGYLTEVLSATDLPCIVSTHQSVGYQIPVHVMSEMADRFPHVAGINCSHQDLAYLSSLATLARGRLDLHVGGPMQALTALSLGATGFLSSEANLAPNLAIAVGAAFDAGDMSALMDSFATLLRLSLLLYGHGGIRATKAVLARLGLPGGVPRRPRLPLEPGAAEELAGLVARLGVTRWESWA